MFYVKEIVSRDPKPVLTLSPSLPVDATTATSTTSTSSRYDQVSEYYGTTLTTSDDLLTNACCTAGAPPLHIQTLIQNIHPSVLAKYYGCGLCVPQYDMTGMTVLDLGCGAGRDVYIGAQLVGPTGRVVGIDMTTEQLQTAKETQAYHAEKFGYDVVEFHHGYLEKLNDLMGNVLQPGTFDVIISNCVLNLCQDKKKVLEHCLTLLKPGGEFYFSDVYASRRVPQTLQDDPVLWGECLTGALYWNDFQTLARTVGFKDPRLVEDDIITIESPAVQQVIDEAGQGGLQFFSATYRLWNMPQLEPFCEDYGQAVIYKGTIPRYTSGWTLDKHHYFETNRLMTVCGNTYNMLKDSVLKEHFQFVGDFTTHFGIFEGCGTTMPFDTTTTSTGASATKGACC